MPSKNTSPSSRSRKGGNNEAQPPHFIAMKASAVGAIQPSPVFLQPLPFILLRGL
jgi:hypothetical protein